MMIIKIMRLTCSFGFDVVRLSAMFGSGVGVALDRAPVAPWYTITAKVPTRYEGHIDIA